MRSILKIKTYEEYSIGENKHTYSIRLTHGVKEGSDEKHDIYGDIKLTVVQYAPGLSPKRFGEIIQEAIKLIKLVINTKVCYMVVC